MFTSLYIYKQCQICVHTYSCTCPDSLITATICKHIHLVALHNSQKNTPIEAIAAIINTTTSEIITTAPRCAVGSDTVLSCLHDPCEDTSNKDEIYLTSEMASITVQIATYLVTTLTRIEKHIFIISLLNADQHQ